jgi:hypothetical protein
MRFQWNNQQPAADPASGIVDPSSSSAAPVVELPPEEPVTDGDDLEKTIDQHVNEEPQQPEMTDVDKRKAPEPEEAGENGTTTASPEGAVTWQPEGSAEQLRWTKRQKRDDTMQFAASSSKRVITDKVKKK